MSWRGQGGPCRTLTRRWHDPSMRYLDAATVESRLTTPVLIEALAAKGKQSLVLVPEIGLTPQTLARFKSRFRVPVVALHSGLTDPERLDVWEAAASGRGSFTLDGKMVDIPIIVRARKLIARYEAIQKREARTLAAMNRPGTLTLRVNPKRATIESVQAELHHAVTTKGTLMPAAMANSALPPTSTSRVWLM